QGKAENRRWWDALLRFLLLERHADVVEAHFSGHGLCKNFLDGSHGLSGGIAGSGSTVDLRGAVLVVAHGEFRAGARLETSDCSKRHHFAFVVLHVELADVFGGSSILALCLDVHLPLAAKSIEIVNEQAAHEGLKSFVDVVNEYSLLDDFVAVHVDVLLRNAGQEGGA